MRRLIGATTAAVLVVGISLTAFGAPEDFCDLLDASFPGNLGTELCAWMNQTDARITELEARNQAMDAADTSASSPLDSDTTLPVTTSTGSQPSTPTAEATNPPTNSTATTVAADSSTESTTSPSPTTTEAAIQTTTTVPKSSTSTTSPSATTTEPAAGGSNHLVITEDTWFNSPIVLGPGSTIRFSNGAQLICAAGCHADWDGITATGEGGVKFLKGSSPSTIRNSLFDVRPSTDAGHHPLHWHLMGDDSRGTLVQNVTIRNSTHFAFVPHGSHGISLIDVRVENVAGPGLWWPSPGTNETCRFQKFCTLDNTNDLTVNRMVVDGVRNSPGDNKGFRLTAYKLGAGSGNSITNSVARDVVAVNVKDCSGFQWPGSANQNVGGNVWVVKNNRSEGSPCHGIFVWQNDQNHHIIDGFVGVPSGSGLRDVGGGIDHGAYSNSYDYRNVDVPYIEVHANHWKVSDSTVGKVYVERHVGAGFVTFTNVLLDVIHMNDAFGGGGVDLIINGGNATCGVVLWENPHPDSRVIIDGVACPRP